MTTIFMGLPTQKQKEMSGLRQRVNGLGQQPGTEWTVTVGQPVETVEPENEQEAPQAVEGETE